MGYFFRLGRNTALLFFCAVLSAGAQTSSGLSNSNSYSNGITKDQRQIKILAARKKAKEKSAERKSAFLKKRAERREARLKSRAPGKKNRKITTLSKKQKTQHISKRKKQRKKSPLKRRTKQKIRKIKKTTYAYVGGRSKGISKRAPWRCVPGRLKKVIAQVSKKYGRVIINSTNRSPSHNRRVGGNSQSYHLRCRAVDFRVRGRTRGLARWLARHPLVGGYKRYPSGFYHIDIGPRRTW